MSINTLNMQPLRVGQIRKLKPCGNGGSSRLVLIAEQDRRDGSFLVFLLSNFVEAAIPRDIRMSREFSSSNYELVLMTEYLARANSDDFDLESLLGKVDLAELQRIRSLAFNNPFGSLPEEILCDGVEIGNYPVQKYDSIWNYRSDEYDNFRKITFIRDEAYVISTTYAFRTYQQFEELRDPELIDELPLDALFSLSRSRELVGAW